MLPFFLYPFFINHYFYSNWKFIWKKEVEPRATKENNNNNKTDGSEKKSN